MDKLRGSNSPTDPTKSASGSPAEVIDTNRGPRLPDRPRGDSATSPQSCIRSSSRRHSWFFKPPLGRFHSNNSQTVREISVLPKEAKLRQICWMSSNSGTEKVRPLKVSGWSASAFPMYALCYDRAYHNKVPRICPPRSKKIVPRLAFGTPSPPVTNRVRTAYLYPRIPDPTMQI